MLEDDDDLDYEEDADYEPPMKPCPRCDGDGLAHGSDRPFEWTPEVGYPGPCPVCGGEGTIENC